MLPRRKFVTGLLASIALAPVLCRALPEVRFPSKPLFGRPPLELWEQQSYWSGTLSPYFLKKYDRQWNREWTYAASDVPAEYSKLSDTDLLDEAHRLSRLAMEELENREWYEKFISTRREYFGDEPKRGSIADVVFPV